MSASDFQQFLSGIALETKALKMTESEALCYCTEVCSEMPKRNDGTIDFNLRYLEVVATRRMFEPTNNSGLFNSLSHVTKSLCPHRKNLDPEINRVNILSKL